MGMMVKHCHSTRLVKTTTQFYGLPHARAKVQSSLLHKIVELYNTDDNYNWAHTLWLDRILTNHMPEGSLIMYLGWWAENTKIMLGWKQQLTGYQTCIWNIHIISCDLCHCKHLITHVDFMISFKRFSIHMPASPLSDQWCHCFVDSFSPNTYVGRLTLSHVNPRAQRWIYNFKILDKIISIYWLDQNPHMRNVFH